MAKGVGMTQNRWRFSWKDILIGDEHIQGISKSQVIPSWDVDGISRAPMSIFSEMFQEEEIGSMLEKVRTNRQIYHRVQHYSRASFVAFLKFLQSRHRVVWLELFHKLVACICESSHVYERCECPGTISPASYPTTLYDRHSSKRRRIHFNSIPFVLARSVFEFVNAFNIAFALSSSASKM